MPFFLDAGAVRQLSDSSEFRTTPVTFLNKAIARVEVAAVIQPGRRLHMSDHHLLLFSTVTVQLIAYISALINTIVR